MSIQDTQIQQLFRPLNPKRVKTRSGAGSYLEAWDVIAHLNRIFGPLNWDKQVVETALIYDEPVDWTTRSGEVKHGWDVAYRATVRLTVRTGGMHGYSAVQSVGYLVPTTVKVSEDSATGQAQHQPSRGDAHDQALKTAVSDALKRAAKDLGNQFGLSLYNNGSTESVVAMSLAHPELVTTDDDEAKDAQSE